MRINSTKEGKKGFVVNYSPQREPAGESLCLNGSDWWLRQTMAEKDFDNVQTVLTKLKSLQKNLPDSLATAESEFISCTVPGSVQTALIENELVPMPPYFGSNIRSMESATVGKQSWLFKKFDVPAEWRGKLVRLRFEAVDYKANFYLNDQWLGTHEGHFSPVSFDVSSILQFDGKNVLAVQLDKFPPDVENPRPGHILDRARTARSQILKNELTDCTPAVCPLGITDDIFLLASDGIYVEDLWVRAKLNDDYSQATISLQLTAKSQSAFYGQVVFTVHSLQTPIQQKEEQLAVQFPEGEHVVTHEMLLPNPQLWWPNGSGAQNLYKAEVTILNGQGRRLDKYATTFGIRKIEMVYNEGHADSQYPWTFVINGQKIYGKGGNWVPMDSFHRMDSARYERLLLQAREANFNIIRWWGGGVPERPAFYNLCDRYGIMLYHDFFLGNEDFDNPTMLNLINSVGAPFIRQRRNHPCIVGWNAGNELWGYDSDEAQAAVANVVAATDPTRPCRPSSPVHWDGEMHSLGATGYQYKTDTDYLTVNGANQQLATEGGFSTIANFSTLEKIIPPDELSNFDPANPSESWLQHNIFWLGHETTLEMYGPIANLQEYVAAAQFSRAQILCYCLEEMRRKKFSWSATMMWQYNETWPNAAGNALVDWFCTPRITYYYVSKAYEPVHISLRYDKIKWRAGEKFAGQLWVTSDLFKDLPASEITWLICDASGKEVVKGQENLTIPANASVKVCDITWDIPAGYDSFFIVYCAIRKRTGATLSVNQYIHTAHTSTPHCFAPLLDAPRTTLSLTVKKRLKYSAELIVKNTGTCNALVCALVLPAPDGAVVMFNENVFSLPPGGERRVMVQAVNPAKPDWRPDFGELTVKAWNSVLVGCDK